MSKNAIDLDLFSVEQKLSLLEEVWDDLTLGGSAPDLAPDVRAELHRRLTEHDRTKASGRPWRDVLAELSAE